MAHVSSLSQTGVATLRSFRLWSLRSAYLRTIANMPGQTFRSAFLTSPTVAGVPRWQQLFLMLCLVCTAGSSWAQASELPHGETSSVSASEVDGILSGFEITRRVLGGDASGRGDWPSVVALTRPGTGPLQDRFFCGGTIVADRWVMTAAHCLFDSFRGQDEPSRIRVIAGIHDLVQDAALEEIIVMSIIVHPGYDNELESPPNDIALLELATTLEAPVGELFVGESEDYSGTIGHIVGWGATRFSNENDADYPTTQQEAPVPLVSLETCNSPISYAGLIQVTQLCAGYAAGQIDTCAGDSGGPLYVVQNGRVLQMGITSFGNGCGQENFYGIYTNLSHYIPWLSQYITVPEQSAELIASRDAAINGGSSHNSSGAMNPFYLLLLVGVCLVRRLACIGSSPKNRLLWRSCQENRKLLLAPIALLMSACTVPSIGAQASSTNTAETPVQEKNSMSEVHTLSLNGDALRSGIDGLQLGVRQEDLVSNLTQGHWQKPLCKSGKTALRGTGRLFQTEHCAVNAEGTVVLHGHQVLKLDLFLLDQQLVRIDVVLATLPAGESSGHTGADNLSDLLEETYEQAAIALPGNENGSAWLWRRQEDQIVLYPGRSLQFIDGRLESSLPALYVFSPPFDID